jgi:heme/copper-type cytochrome/quinol oxidase subunit 2
MVWTYTASTFIISSTKLSTVVILLVVVLALIIHAITSSSRRQNNQVSGVVQYEYDNRFVLTASIFVTLILITILYLSFQYRQSRNIRPPVPSVESSLDKVQNSSNGLLVSQQRQDKNDTVSPTYADVTSTTTSTTNKNTTNSIINSKQEKDSNNRITQTATTTTTETIMSSWKCSCDTNGQFLPKSIFGNMDAIIKMGSGQCYHKQ